MYMSYILDFESKQHTNRDVNPSGRYNATVNVTIKKKSRKLSTTTYQSH